MFLAASKGCQEHFQVRVVEFGGLYATKQYACEAVCAHHMTGFLASVPPKASASEGRSTFDRGPVLRTSDVSLLRLDCHLLGRCELVELELVAQQRFWSQVWIRV